MKTRGWGSVLLAYPTAAAVGAALVAAGFAVAGVIVQAINGMTDQILAGLWITPVAFLYAFVVFLVGLAVIGTPVWLLLFRMGRTKRRDAVLAGTVLCVLAGAASIAAVGEPMASWEPWALAASLAVPGAAAGWTLHRVAYGR
jgi:hypothetical protein